MNGNRDNLIASIVVLNLNGRRHLQPLLAHLALQTVRGFELIFVDNGSSDDSVALVEQGCAAGVDLVMVGHDAAPSLGRAAGCAAGSAGAGATTGFSTITGRSL